MNLRRRNRYFYLSHWLTFTLAIACLAVVDKTAPVWFYPLLVAGLSVAMALPSRWNLNIWSANLLGLALVSVWITWIGLEFYYQEFSGVIVGEDWLRVGFIRGGTLLALLLLAKWLRPRTAGDYWMMHALALVQVVLACATLIARPEDIGYRWFPLLLLGYLACGVSAVIILHVSREAESGDPAQAQDRLWHTAITASLSWWGLGLVLAVFLFLTIPRVGGSGGQAWFRASTFSQSLSGISTGIDLTVSDTLKLSDALILRLDAWDATGNKQWLGKDIRLRAVTCSLYSQGKWRPGSFEDLSYIVYRYPLQPQPGQYRLYFQADLTKLPSAIGLEAQSLEESRAGSVFPLPLAEPHPALVWPARANWFYCETELLGAGVRVREPAVWAALLESTRVLRYEQLYDPRLEVPEITLPQSPRLRLPRIPELSIPSFSTRPAPAPVNEQLDTLDTLPDGLRHTGRIEQFARQVLRRHRLPPDAVPGESADQVLAKVQVLEHYLANNPSEFVYSLSRPRLHFDMDPTEEFLWQPATEDGRKAGWCQHFASALALLLRSQQIPARIVIGFRGADWNPTWKTHEIRAYHAHAWVEAFIGPRGTDGRIRQGRWLAFDPTPAASLTAFDTHQSSWWKMLADDLRYLWEIIILDGVTGQGFRSFATVNTLLDKIRLANITGGELVLTLLRTLGALALVLGALLLWWRLRQPRQRPAPSSVCFSPITNWERDLLDWLQRFLPQRQPGQSLLEYAHLAQHWLFERGCPSSELTTLPVRMTEAYYRYRFAGIVPQDQELADYQQQLTELTRFLEMLQPAARTSSK